MQIIRRGNLHRDRTFGAECPHCTCLFRFALRETRPSYKQGLFQVTCPDEACEHIFIYTPKLHESQGVL